MWIALAFGSAFFAGITSIFAKYGIKKTDSTIATAIRTVVVLIMSLIMVGVVGSFSDIGKIGWKSWLFLILSGIATGASWLCYFKALQLGNVNKVVPIDKSSGILTILLALIIFHEPIGWIKGICIAVIAVGTFLMIDKKDIARNPQEKKSWLFFAVLSAVFASLTTILSKLGIQDMESNLGTAIRTFVVLLMAWLTVFIVKKQGQIKTIEKKELAFICFSGIATGISWLCYFKALQLGQASVVVPIDKLSIVVTIAFSILVLKEKITIKSGIGLCAITIGTILMAIFT